MGWLRSACFVGISFIKSCCVSRCILHCSRNTKVKGAVAINDCGSLHLPVVPFLSLHFTFWHSTLLAQPCVDTFQHISLVERYVLTVFFLTLTPLPKFPLCNNGKFVCNCSYHRNMNIFLSICFMYHISMTAQAFPRLGCFGNSLYIQHLKGHGLILVHTNNRFTKP